METRNSKVENGVQIENQALALLLRNPNGPLDNRIESQTTRQSRS